jgi:hypothetical protein
MKKVVPLVEWQVRNHDCHYPEVTLWVRTRYDYTKLRFRVDTAADCCAIPVATAQREGIVFHFGQLNSWDRRWTRGKSRQIHRVNSGPHWR